MQVIHSVKLSTDEKQELLDLAEAVAETRTSVAYSESERPAALDKATSEFCDMVKDIIHMAFSYGYNEGLNNANIKDTEMYKPIGASPL